MAQCREDKRLAHMHLLDMSAAFNIIPKEVLIPKLWRIGLSREFCQLIFSYMTGRWNAVKVNSHVSDLLNVLTGIGEGSVLEPLVFLVCILETSMIVEVIKEMPRIFLHEPLLQDHLQGKSENWTCQEAEEILDNGEAKAGD